MALPARSARGQSCSAQQQLQETGVLGSADPLVYICEQLLTPSSVITKKISIDFIYLPVLISKLERNSGFWKSVTKTWATKGVQTPVSFVSFFSFSNGGNWSIFTVLSSLPQIFDLKWLLSSSQLLTNSSHASLKLFCVTSRLVLF